MAGKPSACRPPGGRRVRLDSGRRARFLTSKANSSFVFFICWKSRRAVLLTLAGALSCVCAGIPNEGIDRFLHYKGSIEVGGDRALRGPRNRLAG